MKNQQKDLAATEEHKASRKKSEEAAQHQTNAFLLGILQAQHDKVQRRHNKRVENKIQAKAESIAVETKQPRREEEAEEQHKKKEKNKDNREVKRKRSTTTEEWQQKQEDKDKLQQAAKGQ